MSSVEDPEQEPATVTGVAAWSRRRRIGVAVAAMAVVTTVALGIGQLSQGRSVADDRPPATSLTPLKPSSAPASSSTPTAASSSASDPQPASSASASSSSAPATSGPATPSSSATPSSTTSPSVAAKAAPPQVRAEVQPEPAAEELVPAIVNGNSTLQSGESIDLSSIASGAMLEEMNSAAQEAALNGMKQVGQPTVASVTVTASRLDANPRSFDVAACIDSTGVKVMANGVDQTDPNAPKRSLNLYTVEEHDGAWLVISRSFPANPDC